MKDVYSSVEEVTNILELKESENILSHEKDFTAVGGASNSHACNWVHCQQ